MSDEQGAGPAGAAAGARSHEQVFPGDSELARLMRAVDWSATPLGPVEGWPQSLCTMVRILLANRFPLLLWWGPDQCQLYNDAYRPVLGSKHPRSLGQPARECWEEIWPIIGPLILTPLNGGPATWDDDLFLEVQRHGFAEETHFTVAYSPVPDESTPNGVGGVLATVHEITAQVVPARRVAALRDLGARSSEGKTAEEACAIAAEAFERHPKDVPFALLYLLDADRQTARLTSAVGVGLGEPASPLTVDLGGESPGETPWPFALVARTEAPQVVERLSERFSVVPPGPWSDPPRRAMVLPIPSNVQHRLAGLLVLGLSARLELDDFYRSFCELAAAQVATAIANARAYEEERRRAEALAELDRAKTAFFSNVSHEFRTPLTLLLGPTEALLAGADGALAPRQREELTVIHRNSLRLLRLVNTLLDFSRLEAGRVQANYEPTDLPALTADLASQFRAAVEGAGLRLKVDCSPLPADVAVYVDRDMWEKVVLNLLSNAFKFTFAGEIGVSLRASDDQHSVLLAVCDTGTGIAAEELPRLFQRFHRVQGAQARTHEGTGIGLALVQELATLHGGTVEVASEVGRGTTFTVTIPAGKAHLPADRIGAARNSASTAIGAAPFVEEALRWLPGGADEAVTSDGALGSAARSRETARDRSVGDEEGAACTTLPPISSSPVVLLADDNADMRRYVARLLGERYEVQAVPDGEAALAAARKRPPDLVLADVMMPRLDGFDLLRALRADERTREIPVILLSARAGEEATVEGMDAGADDYLVKPFSARELLARVDGRIELARARRAQAGLEKQARLAAETERTRLEQVLDVLPAGVAIADGSGRFIMVNRVARDLLGFDCTGRTMPTAEDAAYTEYGARRPDGSPYPSAELPLQRSFLRGETVRGARFSIRNASSGREFPVLANSAPLFTAEGQHAGGVVVFQDITAIRDLEQQKDAFLSAASHDLQQPVAAIRGYAQLLQRRLRRVEPPDREGTLTILAGVEETTARLSDQIAELLDVSRLQMGRPLELDRTPTDLVELVRRATAAYQEAGDGRPWRLTVPAEPLEMSVDATRMRRTVDNLLANAAKYSPPEAEIAVAVNREAGAGADWAVLRVRDHGIGIPAADLPHIFERFYRAGNVAGRVAGTGIGLAGARQIVEQHGGTIAVESREGAGTTVTVRLPLEQSDGPAPMDHPG